MRDSTLRRSTTRASPSRRANASFFCGESGCGKTTATRIVNGLAGGFYEGSRTGKVLVAGRDIDDLEDWELSSLTGSVFQNPRTQFFNLDTTGEIAFGMENLGVPGRRCTDGCVASCASSAWKGSWAGASSRALRGPDAIGGVRERMGLQAERLRPRRAVEQSGSSLHGEARLLHLESQVERVCRDHRRAQALLPRRRRRPVPALRRRFRRRRMGRAAIPGAARLRARVLRAQVLRAAEARRPDAAPFPSRLRLSRRRGEGDLCGV